MLRPSEAFRHCPSCGAARAGGPGANPYHCPPCGFTFYFNPTVAAAGFLFDPAGRVLLIRRAKDPAKGKFAVPGGFVDADESAEEALRREVREEVGVEIEGVEYLGSFVNHYPYRGVTYPVLDLSFTARVIDPAAARPLDAVAGIEWLHLPDIPPEDLAFPSLRVGLDLLLGETKRPPATGGVSRPSHSHRLIAPEPGSSAAWCRSASPPCRPGGHSSPASVRRPGWGRWSRSAGRRRARG